MASAYCDKVDQLGRLQGALVHHHVDVSVLVLTMMADLADAVAVGAVRVLGAAGRRLHLPQFVLVLHEWLVREVLMDGDGAHHRADAVRMSR